MLSVVLDGLLVTSFSTAVVDFGFGVVFLLLDFDLGVVLGFEVVVF